MNSAILSKGSVLLAENDVLAAPDIQCKTAPSARQNDDIGDMTLEVAECCLIKSALVKTLGNIAESAAMLEISQSSLYRRMEKYEICNIEKTATTLISTSFKMPMIGINSAPQQAFDQQIVVTFTK